MINHFTRKQLLASTTISSALLLAAPAYAQTTQEAPTAPAVSNPAPGTPAPVSNDGSNGQNAGGDIVVTGSRIPHPDLESASPVTVVGAQEVRQTGTTRIEDLLNALPQVFAGQGGGISNGSTGTATVDLRGLGSSRTLVLVNGRRLVPGDPRDPVPDINIIPAALIRRVDVLTGGASSVYGADAVSGVVNFVMDTDFSGFRVDGQYSFYNHVNRIDPNDSIRQALNARNFGYPNGVSADGGTVDVTAVIGAGFDDNRGHVTAYGSYRRINAVTQAARDYSACALSGTSSAQLAASGRLYNCGGSITSAPGAFYTGGQYYNVQGNRFAPGTVLYNYAPTNYFQRPDERYTAGFFAHYDVSPAFKPYMEFMFMDDRSVAQIAPSGAFFGNTSTINCDNPLLSAQQAGIICGAAAGTATNATLYVARRNVEGGPRQDDLQHTTYRGVIGARGDVVRGISYDAYYQYSRVNFAQTYRNDFSITRTRRALDVVSVGGVPTCRSVVDGTDPNCVPYNIFTTGGVTQAALNYLQIPLLSRGQTTEQVADASVTFQGGEYGITSPLATEGFALNVGGEYRRETLNFEPDVSFLTGDGAGQGGATTAVAGNIRVYEAFAEASLPLIQGRSFFEDLRIGAGYRRSHYDTSGNGVTNSFDTDTYKVEGSWTPFRDIKFRGSYNRAVRAPNATELFAAQSIVLDGSIDPCALPNGTTFNGTTVNGYTQAQCAQTGLTAAQFGKIGANPSQQYNGLTGGNPNLTPEISDSITFGVVLQPRFLRGFTATVDYFNIRLRNQIGVIGANTIINQCLATGSSDYCSLVRRGVSGRLDRPDGYIIDTNLNAGRLSTKGIDVTLGYTQQLGSSGTLGLSLVGTWLDSLRYDPVGSADYNCAGFFGNQCGTPNPEWRHKFRVTYTLPSGISLSGAWRYFSRVRSDATSSDTDLASTGNGSYLGNRRIDAQSYFDLALTVPVQDRFTFRIGSQNILDRAPPVNGLGIGVVENGNTFAQVYDSLGRYIYAGITLNL